MVQRDGAGEPAVSAGLRGDVGAADSRGRVLAALHRHIRPHRPDAPAAQLRGPLHVRTAGGERLRAARLHPAVPPFGAVGKRRQLQREPHLHRRGGQRSHLRHPGGADGLPPGEPVDPQQDWSADAAGDSGVDGHQRSLRLHLPGHRQVGARRRPRRGVRAGAGLGAEVPAGAERRPLQDDGRGGPGADGRRRWPAAAGTAQR